MAYLRLRYVKKEGFFAKLLKCDGKCQYLFPMYLCLPTVTETQN